MWGKNNGAKKHRIYRITMHLHRTTWAYEGPEPKSLWIQMKLYTKKQTNSNKSAKKSPYSGDIVYFSSKITIAGNLRPRQIQETHRRITIIWHVILRYIFVLGQTYILRNFFPYHWQYFAQIYITFSAHQHHQS